MELSGRGSFTQVPQPVQERALRGLEILILCLLVAGSLGSLTRQNLPRSLRFGIIGLLILACVLHVIFEGAHWQMIPAYLAVILLATLLAPAALTKRWKLAGASAILFLATAGCCFSAALPMFRLPDPTGVYPIGTRVFYLVDRSRIEDADGIGNRPRELMIQVWYPAQPSRGALAPYRRWAETTPMSSYQSVVWTHSRWNAPIATAQSSYPVILFNPAWNGRRTQDTFLTEELASHGFLVVGIDHPYNSGPVAFPDGRILPVGTARGLYGPSVTPAQFDAIVDKEVEKETADTLFVLDQIQRWNHDPSSPFFQRADTTRVGAFGHSLGAAVSAEAAYRDPRILSALDMDTELFGEVGRNGLAKPFMLLNEDMTHYSPEELNRMPPSIRNGEIQNQQDYDRLFGMLRKYGGYQVYLHGTNHGSYTDNVLFSPFHALENPGAIPARRLQFILRQYVLAFFQQTLRGEKPALLANGSTPFPEVSVKFESAPVASPQAEARNSAARP